MDLVNPDGFQEEDIHKLLSLEIVSKVTILQILYQFSKLNKEERCKVIGEWFSEFFELPVNIIQHVNKELLN